MAKWTLTTTDEDIDAALEAAKHQPPWPQIVEMTYHRDLDIFLIKVDNGRRLVIAREDIWAVRNATPEQASDFRIQHFRDAIWWTQVDEGLRLESALEGRYGNKAWMDYVHRRKPVVA
jgi:hypothetical protein